jgi:hypothetical protein
VLSLAELNGDEILNDDAEGLLRWPHWQGGVTAGQEGFWPSCRSTLGTGGCWDGMMKHWRDGKPQGVPIPVVQPNSDWRMARLPNGDLVSTNGRSSFIRRVVQLQEAVAQVC